MAHFAKVDENNIVLQVVVTDNSYPEEGYEWLLDTFGGRWIQTSYNSRIRKNFAGVGYSYDESLDAFIAPKPYDSWTLDLETCQWVPPVQRPSGETIYVWDEESLNWKEAV